MTKKGIFEIILLFLCLSETDIMSGIKSLSINPLNKKTKKKIETINSIMDNFILDAIQQYNSQYFRCLEIQDNESLSYSDKLFERFSQFSQETFNTLRDLFKKQITEDVASKKIKEITTDFCQDIKTYEETVVNKLNFNGETWINGFRKTTKALEKAIFDGIDAYQDQIITVIIEEQKKQEKMRLFGMACAAITCGIGYKYPASTIITLGLLGATVAPLHQYKNEITEKIFSLFGFFGYATFLYLLSRGIDSIGKNYNIEWYRVFKEYCLAFREQQLRSRLRKTFIDE